MSKIKLFDAYIDNSEKKALELIIKKNPRSRYLANVKPKNTASGKFFKNNGLNLSNILMNKKLNKLWN